jgi:integrase-like protein
LKNSLSVEQPIAGDELRALKRFLATREDNLPWLFISERQAQLTRQAVNYIVRVAGETARLGRDWPHMLHHSCGYYLADKGTDLRHVGLPWASRCKAHRALHARRWPPVRGAVAVGLDPAEPADRRAKETGKGKRSTHGAIRRSPLQAPKVAYGHVGLILSYVCREIPAEDRMILSCRDAAPCLPRRAMP